MKYHRRVITIKAEDSPNVRYAMAEIAAGKPVSNTIIVPGVLTYEQYLYRRATWDKVRQSIGLDARFYVGAQLLLYPPDWLDRAHRMHRALGSRRRIATGIGIDPAEGGDKTSMTAVDELGLIELVSKKTPDTSVIQGEALAFIKKHGVTDPNKVCIDRGGGGKQIADNIARDTGFEIRTIAFGEAPSLDLKYGTYPLSERKDTQEERYVYLNRRAQMFWELSYCLDPQGDVTTSDRQTFAIPGEQYGEQYADLRRQLSVMDKLYDKEGRIRMRAKNRVGPGNGTGEKTLVELIGHSPDEADSVVLAVHARDHERFVQIVGGF